MATRAFRLVILLLWLYPTIASAQTDQVDSYVKKQVERRHIPGLSLAVVRGGEVVLARGYGMANVELSVPATPESVYELASVSKQFTATAIMLLVEDGKLGLDDPITDRLPNLPEAWGGITLRNLLNHTSGIRDFYGTKRLSLRNDYANDELVKFVSDLPLEFPPGEKWAYSNTNYLLVGMIIEKAGGKPLAEFLAERIFRPLGMTATRINDTLAVIPYRATGYVRHGSNLRIRDFISPTLRATGAGGIVSSVLDLAKWDAALNSDKLLKRSVLRQMWTPAKLKNGQATWYGFGWEVGEENGHKFVGHTGGIPGFSAHISRYADDKLTVIVLANSSSADTGTIALGVASKYIPELARPERKPIEDKEPETTKALKAVPVSTLGGMLDSDLFTAEASKARLPGKVEEMGRSLAPLGPLKAFDLIGREDAGGIRVHSDRGVLGDTPTIMTVVLAADGKIAGLSLVPE
jgi:D-alanyl-D-alanine carboxypeptidase